MVSASPFHSLAGRAIGFALSSIPDLYAFLSPREDIPHPSDFMLHQVFVKRVEDLQSTDECSGNHIVVTVIHQGHLALEITSYLRLTPGFILVVKW